MAALGLYGWRRYTVPGALPFAILMVFTSLLGVGASLQLAAVDISSKIFWFKFQYFWQEPALVTGLWFVLDYARLGRFLTRRNRILLFIYIIPGSSLILTNDLHHWLWLGSSLDGVLPPLRGSGYWILSFPGYLLALLNLPVLIWLFVRSPLHRWPVAFILCGQLMVRAALTLGLIQIEPIKAISLGILALSFNASMYAIALFGFRLFDPIPAARKTVIERMADGMLVLDTDQCIVDVNPAAQALFNFPRKKVIGREACQMLEAYPSLQRLLNDPTITHTGYRIGRIRTGMRCTSRHCSIRGASTWDRSCSFMM
jgi:PAS domain-containing protein